MTILKKLNSFVLKIWILSLCACACTDAAGLGECCQLSVIDDLCNNTCVDVLSDSAVTLTEIQALGSACSPTYYTFWFCINRTITTDVNNTNEIITTEGNIPTTSSVPACSPCEHVPTSYHTVYDQDDVCCNMSPVSSCRETCSESLQTHDGNITAASNELIGDCGVPPIDPIWSCLIRLGTPSPTGPTLAPPSMYADWARVQCCYKAKDETCKNSCLDFYSGQVSASSWTTFQLDCIHRPNENLLSTCLADVTNACQLGCSGMQFCRNFNNRPFQFFRKCTTSADRLAKSSYHSWIHNQIIVHPLVKLFVPDVDECLPEAWKAVACITHLQPCHSTTHATQICRVDCVRLLTRCTNSSATAKATCDIIAPKSTEGHCISLNQFLQPSTFGDDIISTITEEIENPCDPNPCNDGFFCGINRMCDFTDQSCTPFICRPGCVVGATPSILLPESSGVRVNLVSYSQNGCYGYLNCSSATNALSANDGTNSDIGFSPITNRHCETEESCTLGDDYYGHRSKFWIGCNFCTCYFGRITCTNRTCIGNQTSMMDCKCTNEYEPVCTRDGITISNRCRALCFGYETGDYHRGDCGSVNSCSNFNNFCGTNSRCIPHRYSCLSSTRSQCFQYRCESLDNEACAQQSSPVCDTADNQHNSLCAFLRTNGEFNYFGDCKPECSDSDSHVCGVNGETFTSECHAYDVHIYVDYYSRCHSTPGSSPDLTSCSNVKCPKLVHSSCRAVTPWGACCPLCGTALTILMDKTVLQKNIHSLNRSILSSTDMVYRLQYYISYRQCELFGHVAVDGSLTVIVVPKQSADVTPLLIEVCHQEAVKLSTFINNQTPMLASDPFLSHFIAANISKSIENESVSATEIQSTPSITNNCVKCVPNIPFILLFTFVFLIY